MLKKIAIYMLVLLGLMYLFGLGKGTPQEDATTQSSVTISGYTSNNFTLGSSVIIDIKNEKDIPLSLETGDGNPPFEIKFQDSSVGYPEVKHDVFWPASIEPKQNYIFSFDIWSKELFNKAGAYTVSLKSKSLAKEDKIITTINITERGTLGHLWETLLIKPIYNTLIFITENVPGRSLGWGIIILTILIRLILLIPNQRALESQKSMQELQPKLAEIQAKYKEDRTKLSQETMALWKKHKVNPFGSCLPIIIQIPILLALYYVIRDGLLLSSTRWLYAPLANLDISSISTMFLGILPLDRADIYVIPATLVILQFLQLKLGMAKKPAAAPTGQPDPMKAMLYIMPIMIGFMSATFPSAISLYWGTSTIFGIFQQLVVNKEKPSQLG